MDLILLFLAFLGIIVGISGGLVVSKYNRKDMIVGGIIIIMLGLFILFYLLLTTIMR